MARNDRSPEQFEKIAAQLSEASATLLAVAAMMRDGGMPTALIHGSTTINRYLPSVLEWADKIHGDVKSQLRAFEAGIQSNAERQKQLNETAKLASARKQPAAKKTAHEKAVKKKS